MTQEGDKWDRLATTYMEKFDMAFNGMRLEYDLDNDGTVQGEEVALNATELRILRA